MAGLLAIFGRRELVGLSASYTKAMAQQSAHNALLENQAWLRTGQSELGAPWPATTRWRRWPRPRSTRSTRYVGGLVAAMYVREDGGVMRRVATYGFAEAWAGQNQVFQPGESLVGQAVREDRLLAVEELPQDYIKVSSGLGRAAPSQLVISPFRNEGEINGVIEIGFLHADRRARPRTSWNWSARASAPRWRRQNIASACRNRWPKPSN